MSKKTKFTNRVLSGVVVFILAIILTILQDDTQENKNTPALSNNVDEKVSVHYIDVGQGDSIFIQSGNSTMLIDAGENDKGDQVVAYLKSQGVEQLDYVIGTHPHSDHIGGLDTVINNFPVKQVMLPKVTHTTKTYEDVLKAVQKQGLKVTVPNVGDTYQLGELGITVISPGEDYGDELNNWSIGVIAKYKEVSFLMSGDAEVDAEQWMVEHNNDISATVLKLNHHGSSTSSSQQFLDAVNPQYVIISLGKDNKYGHPHKEVMERLEKMNVPIYRTDTMGTIVVSTDGENISIQTENKSNR